MKPPVIKRAERPKKERKPSLVQPNLGTTPRKAMQNMHGGRIEDRLIGYYQKSGLDLPDLSKKSKLEKLRILAQATSDVEKLHKKASNQINKHNKEVENENKKRKAAESQESAGQQGPPPGAKP